MPNEKERQEHYSIAETIFHKIEHLRDFEKVEAFNRELNAIDVRYKTGVELLVWSWVKYGKPKKTKFERLSIAYSAITKVADSKGKRFSIAIAVCIAVGGSLVWKGSLSLPISGGAAKEDELRDWRANGGKNLIVFIHGLRDDGEETWTSPNTNISWQSLLLEDERFSEYDIKSYHYASYLFDGTRLSIPNC